MERKRHIFIIATLVSTLGQFAADLYLPSLYVLSQDLHASYSLAQLTITTYMAGFAISQIVYGPASDAFGRRSPLLIGLFLSVLGSIACLCAYNINMLILGRLLQGIGMGSAGALYRPILSDLFQGEKLVKYASIAALIGIWFLAIGPVFGGYIQHYTDWRVIFGLLTLLSLMAFFSVLVYIPETNLNIDKHNINIVQIKNNVVSLFTNKSFVGYNFCSMFAYAAIAAWLTSGSILLQKTMGLNSIEFGWGYFFTGLTFILGSIINIKYSYKCGIDKMIQVGLVTIFLASIIMLALNYLGYMNAFSVVGPVMIVFFGTPLIFANSFAGAIKSFTKISGLASAIFSASRMLGGALGSWIIAFANVDNQIPMALAFLVCAIMGWFGHSLVLQHNEPSLIKVDLTPDQ